MAEALASVKRQLGSQAVILLLAHALHGSHAPLGEAARLVQEPPDHRGLPVVDVPDDGDAQPALSVAAHLYMYPRARSFCMAYVSSWSWARPARSEVFTVFSSSMISATVLACDSIAPVQGEQPRLR